MDGTAVQAFRVVFFLIYIFYQCIYVYIIMAYKLVHLHGIYIANA